MGELKDIIYIIVTLGGVFATVIGFYWRTRFVLERSEKQFCEQELRLSRVEQRTERIQRTIERKINVIEKNIVRILEKLDIEPAHTLFDDEEK